jgi:nicotinamide mononucleotide transporter
LQVFIEQLLNTPPVEWLGMISGILGVWFSVRQKIVAWPLFILCYGCYVVISYRYGVYAFLGMNALFVGLSIYGWIKWSRGAGESGPAKITRTSRKQWLLLALLIAGGTLAIGWLLGFLGEANYPFADALATCCALVAQWMLGRKQIETWLLWIVADLIYLVLFILGGSFPTVVLFALFLILAVKGWRDWSRALRTAEP